MTRPLIVLLLAVATIGCGGDGPTEPSVQSLVGTYVLTSINGGALPQAIAAEPPSVTRVISGRLTITPDHAFTDSTWTERVTMNPDATFTVEESVSALTGHTGTLRVTPQGVERLVLRAPPLLDLTYQYHRE